MWLDSRSPASVDQQNDAPANTTETEQNKQDLADTLSMDDLETQLGAFKADLWSLKQEVTFTAAYKEQIQLLPVEQQPIADSFITLWAEYQQVLTQYEENPDHDPAAFQADTIGHIMKMTSMISENPFLEQFTDLIADARTQLTNSYQEDMALADTMNDEITDPFLDSEVA